MVIPTYRRPFLLTKCLCALADQCFEKSDYEIIVVSDGPDADTFEVVKQWLDEHGLPVHYRPLAEKKGPAACRNAGWKQAKAPLIAFTDDDCIPADNWLASIMKEYQGARYAVYTGKVCVPISDQPTDYERNVACLETAEFVTANCICTRAALEWVNGFDERFRTAWREDSDLHFKFLKADVPIRRIEATVVHPVRKARWGVSIVEQRKNVYNALLYKKHPVLFRQRIKPSPSWHYYLMVLLFMAMLTAIAGGSDLLALATLASWLILLLAFIKKRMKNTSKKRSYLLEIIITSVLIPFISVYWNLYGALKFRVVFL